MYKPIPGQLILTTQKIKGSIPFVMTEPLAQR